MRRYRHQTGRVMGGASCGCAAPCSTSQNCSCHNCLLCFDVEHCSSGLPTQLDEVRGDSAVCQWGADLGEENARLPDCGARYLSVRALLEGAEQRLVQAIACDIQCITLQ